MVLPVSQRWKNDSEPPSAQKRTHSVVISLTQSSVKTTNFSGCGGGEFSHRMQDKQESNKKEDGERATTSPIQREPIYESPSNPSPERIRDNASVHNNSMGQPPEPQSCVSNTSAVSFLPADEYYSVPPQVRAIIKQYRYLSPEDMVALSDVTQRKLARDVYAQIKSSNWYLPHTRNVDVEAGEKPWDISYSHEVGVVLCVAGKRIEVHLFSYLCRIIVMGLIWLAVWSALPKHLMELHGYIFDPLLVFVVSALVGGFVCRILTIPPLIGIFFVAIALNNVPSAGELTRGIYKDVRTVISTIGLTMILTRAGLSLNLRLLKPIAFNALALGIIPLVFEAVSSALMAKWLFEYDDYKWAFFHGFTLSPVGAAIVVPGVLALQDQGYGAKGGPPLLQLASVPIDAVIGIPLIYFWSDLIFENRPVGLAIGLLPLQVAIGAVIGCVAAWLIYIAMIQFLDERKRLPNGSHSEAQLRAAGRSVVFLLTVALCAAKFQSDRLGYSGAGATCVICCSAFFGHLLLKDGNLEYLSMRKRICGIIAQVWDLIVMPALFAMTGSSIVLKDLFSSAFFGRAIACLSVGWALRLGGALACGLGTDFNKKEYCALAIGWLGKAGMQAALGSLAYRRALEGVGSGMDPATLAKNLQYGSIILRSAALQLAISAPVGSLALALVVPKLVRKDAGPPDQRAGAPDVVAVVTASPKQ